MKTKILYTNISLQCILCCLNQNDTCLHLLCCCTNKHINNLRSNRFNKAVHAIVDTPLAHPHTQHFTLVHAGTQHQWQPQNTLPTWLLPCYCFLTKCKYLAKLRPNNLCVKAKSPIDFPPIIPHSSITLQFIGFTYGNDKFPIDATTWRHAKYDALIPHLESRG